MNYELWDMVSYGAGEDLVPFTKLKTDEKFFVVYQEFLKTIKDKPCVILISEEKKEPAYIYESPDGGKTIFRREIGSTERTKVK